MINLIRNVENKTKWSYIKKKKYIKIQENNKSSIFNTFLRTWKRKDLLKWMNNFLESKNNYKFNFSNYSYNNCRAPLSFKQKWKLKVNAIPNIDRTLENLNSMFIDSK